MNKEEIKARVCELFEFGEDKWFDYEQEFIALAESAAASEREACAKECEVMRISTFPEIMEPRERDSHECADAIRSRK